MIDTDNSSLIGTRLAFEMQRGVIDAKSMFELMLYLCTNRVPGADQLILHDNMCT